MIYESIQVVNKSGISNNLKDTKYLPVKTMMKQSYFGFIYTITIIEAYVVNMWHVEYF